MASSYPTSLDSFTDPTSGSSLASPSHSGQHIDLNDAVEKLETKLGIGSSPASSAVNGAVLVANGSGSTSWQKLGVVALSNLTANGSFVNAETTRTSVTFTAVANRYYKLTWYEPHLNNANASVNNLYLRLDNATTGTIIASTKFYLAAGYDAPIILECVTTFSAGSRTIYARGDENAATATTLTASATKPAFLLVEDIGPV